MDRIDQKQTLNLRRNAMRKRYGKVGVGLAVAAVIAEGKVRTYDMGGSCSTLEVAEAVASRL